MQAVVEGRITKDVVIETLASGKTVANVRIAENKFYTDDKGARQTKTNFHTVKVWNQVATALCRIAAKGDLVKFRVTRDTAFLLERAPSGSH